MQTMTKTTKPGLAPSTKPPADPR